MPNRDIHRPVGTVIGAASGYYAARNFDPAHKLAETAGAALGGYVGSAAPDWIDPATSPNHRHVGHGIANFVGGVWITGDLIANLQHRLRERADALQAQRLCLTDGLQIILYTVEEYFLRFLAGLLNGFTAGYLSHLFLDALTARSIPLVARGS